VGRGRRDLRDVKDQNTGARCGEQFTRRLADECTLFICVEESLVGCTIRYTDAGVAGRKR